ncbi:Hsp70 family protein [Photobacterium rosenbergii]|uniref:Hsp70 family protein n=1 Tax=Photobacterium rosenbergii TaxID=294936 RepID=UPI001C99A4BD|nr:Hsp70 family protein [Photobacterium rosenbergii]MBY5946008.1 Hsp70 family protein [Photobacterium rosenbergii]
MSSMINFGIDLGTTNSLIAKFDKGNVEVFKNPKGFKESLPSVVGFRNNRILVGDAAKNYVERDAKSVASRFKRKMGTTETLKIKSTGDSKTPVELSSFVLKELKSFVHSGESVESAVLTIPASFDTVQSNATKQAGIEAGFKQVVLLQEPIAASLAYANKANSEDLRNSQWIVYDLGGGTFDVALVKIIEGELTVVDHEGDNYLGGSDFDELIVEKLIVPALERQGVFEDLIGELKSETGKYNQIWFRLLEAAEQAKVELSTATSTDIDLGMTDLEDDEGDLIDSLITITRSEFEEVIREEVDGTAEMMKKIITRNSLQPSDLKFTLMVGGSTLIPFVRSRIEELMGIPVNVSIDPTNAITIGAAYFAGTKQKEIMPSDSNIFENTRNIKVKAVFERNSQDIEEMFNAKINGDIDGLFYRIYSEDGSFDSGLKSLANRISEDLPLREGAFNHFNFQVVDGQNNPIDVGFNSIQIAQGRYSVAGQVLPEDISLVKDDLNNKDTLLDCVFERNCVLPTRGKRTVEVAKTIAQGSDDEVKIMVVEGPAARHSTTNKQIGVLSISGEQISKDLLKGTEIDLIIEMSESRDLTVSAYLNGTDQEFSQVFQGTKRLVEPKILTTEVFQLEDRIQVEMEDAASHNKPEVVYQLQKLLKEANSLSAETTDLPMDDVTDDRFKLEDKKRQLAQQIYQLTSSKRLDAAKLEYMEAKEEVTRLIRENGNDHELHQLQEIVAREQIFIHSASPEKIEAPTAELHTLGFQIRWRMPEFLLGMFEYLKERRISMNDQSYAKQLFESGHRAIENEAWDDLRDINGMLWELMPETERPAEDIQMFTGIV